MNIKCMWHSCGHCASNNVHFFHVGLSLFSVLVSESVAPVETVLNLVRTSLSGSPLSVWHCLTMPVRCIGLCGISVDCFDCMKRFLFAQYNMQFLFVYELDQLVRFLRLHCWINVVHSSNFCGTMWIFFSIMCVKGKTSLLSGHYLTITQKLWIMRRWCVISAMIFSQHLFFYFAAWPSVFPWSSAVTVELNVTCYEDLLNFAE